MKGTVRLLLPAFFVVALVIASPLRAKDPADSPPDLVLYRRQQAQGSTWTSAKPLPESLAEAGLGADWRVVWATMYLDGGTEGFLLKDGQGRYLALCTGPGLQTGEMQARSGDVSHSRVFLGGLHYLEAEALKVPKDAAAERFVKGLLAEVQERRATSTPPPVKP